MRIVPQPSLQVKRGIGHVLQSERIEAQVNMGKCGYLGKPEDAGLAATHITGSRSGRSPA